MYAGAELFVAGLCITSLVREGRSVDDIGLVAPRSRAWWSTLTAVLVVSGTIIALRHFDAITIVGRPGQDYGALEPLTTANRLLIVFSSALVVPLEEIIWRGFAVSRLRSMSAPTWLAVAAPSVAFGYFHGGTIDTLWISALILVAAIGLCGVYLRTRSLAWPFLIHFGWNALLVSVTPTPP